MKTPKRDEPGYEVTIVSSNPETLDDLQSYLQAAGITARCARDLSACVKLAPQRTLALVLFPDDFRSESVVSTLAVVARRKTSTLPILVTAHPQRFEGLTTAGRVLIVPRPVWGWTILDAIREQIGNRKPVRAKRARGH